MRTRAPSAKQHGTAMMNGDPKFEQRVECDEVQAIRDTYQDDWEKNVGRVGIGRKKVPHAPLAVKVFPEEDQQASTHRHTHDGFPERVDQRLPVEPAQKVVEMIGASSPFYKGRRRARGQ